METYDATVTVDCPGCGRELVVDVFRGYERPYIEIEEGTGCPDGCDKDVTHCGIIMDRSFIEWENLINCRAAR